MKKIILLLLLAAGLINAYAQTGDPTIVTSIKENTTERQIKKLLILSAGPMSSRKIAQDVKYALDKELKNEAFSSSLMYLGDVSHVTDENIRIASRMYPHDAILVIAPEFVADSTKDYVHRTLAYNIFLRDYGRPAKKKGTKEFTNQLSIFSLLDDTNLTEPYWAAQIAISTNLGSDKYFNHLVKMLKETWYSQMISLGS
ncbi:hypothetical protein [Chitinophaga vietnamensis]|uniref:hypothetical protein n=1 Tax=Chitinophaga vietnamensis TaxID=2593957 RepID=UPI00117810FC|nr:hypothetical protein [Chitinophaga vietnamensis]